MAWPGGGRMTEREMPDWVRRYKPYKVVAVFQQDLNGKVRNVAELQCPRSHCKGVFVVDREQFKEQLVGIAKPFVPHTRHCPYCCMVSRVPESTA